MREDWNLNAEHRRRHRLPEEILVALVVGVRDEGAHTHQQLGAGGFDEDGGAVGLREGDAVVGARVVAGFEFGLRDGGLKRHVPQRRRVVHVRLAAGEIAQEGFLGDGLGVAPDRRVEQIPVHRQSEPAPQRLEHLLVDGRQFLAQLDEVATRHRHLALRVRLGRRLEIGVVGQRRVTAHAVVVLHAALGGQTVIVPTHRVEHFLAAHALVAGHHVGVGVAEYVTDVQ